MQQLGNEEFKATKESPCNKATVEEGIGFWSRPAMIEKKKKRQPLTVIQSKEKKVERARSHLFGGMHDISNPNLYYL